MCTDEHVSVAHLVLARFTLCFSTQASGGQDKVVHVWDVRNNVHLHTFSGHRDMVSVSSTAQQKYIHTFIDIINATLICCRVWLSREELMNYSAAHLTEPSRSGTLMKWPMWRPCKYIYYGSIPGKHPWALHMHITSNFLHIWMFTQDRKFSYDRVLIHHCKIATWALTRDTTECYCRMFAL